MKGELNKMAGFTWHNLEAPILSVFVRRFLVDNGVYDFVVEAPVELTIVFRGDELTLELHGVAGSGCPIVSTPLSVYHVGLERYAMLTFRSLAEERI